MPPYRLGRHWNTIETYLIPVIEDDIGELGKELKKFMDICLFFSSMFSSRHAVPCANQSIRAPRSTAIKEVFATASIVKRAFAHNTKSIGTYPFFKVWSPATNAKIPCV